MFCLCFLFKVCLWRVDVVKAKTWFPLLNIVNCEIQLLVKYVINKEFALLSCCG